MSKKSNATVQWPDTASDADGLPTNGSQNGEDACQDCLYNLHVSTVSIIVAIMWCIRIENSRL